MLWDYGTAIRSIIPGGNLCGASDFNPKCLWLPVLANLFVDLFMLLFYSSLRGYFTVIFGWEMQFFHSYYWNLSMLLFYSSLRGYFMVIFG